MKKILILVLLLVAGATQAQPAVRLAKTTGNPVLPGWCADSGAAIFGKQYWIYSTFSAPTGSMYFANQPDPNTRISRNQRLFLDAFSSPDLVYRTKHPHVFYTFRVKWVRHAMWALLIPKKNGNQYLFFKANDIQNDQQCGGIGVTVAVDPAGPFRDHLGHSSFADRFYNHAQSINQLIFKDGIGKYYFVSGWAHCNIAQLNDDFTGFVPFAVGTTFRAITPEGYVDGPIMFLRRGKYYFMWSEGEWTGPSYSVALAVGDSFFGSFRRVGKVLQQDLAVGTGAGHHSVLQVPGTDEWYIAYLRHPLGDNEGNHLKACIDEMQFDQAGRILPVKTSTQDVATQFLR